MKNGDGTEIEVGHVVLDRGRPERDIVIGIDPEKGDFIKLLHIGTVKKEDSPSFGESIILPVGNMRSARLRI